VLDWTSPYEAPTSLDGPRMFGPHSQRTAKWTAAATVAVAVCVGLVIVGYVQTADLNLFWLVPLGLWLPICYVMASPVAGRPPEYWIGAAIQFRRGGPPELPSPPAAAIIELTRTRNLRLAEDEALGTAAKSLWAFLNGFQYPLKIVVRAWPQAGGIERRWFIGVQAPTPEVLSERVASILRGLAKQRLAGVRLTDQEATALTELPRRRGVHRDYLALDEHLAGYLLAAAPRATETNWLAPVLDGDLAVDCSLALEPLDNATEMSSLDDRLVEWQSAQILNVNSGRGEDPDVDNKIKDAARTRLLLSRRQLRVYLTTVGFVVRAPDQATLEHQAGLLTTQLAELVGVPMPVIPMRYEHAATPALVDPRRDCPVTFPIRMVTPALARTYPFSNSSLSMPGGTPCGTSVGSLRENRLNLFEPFSHVVVLGTTNAGKSFWVKTYLLRLMRAEPRTRVLLIQCERDEYGRLARAMGSHGHTDVCHTMAEVEALVYGATGNFRTMAQCHLVDLTQLPKAARGAALAFVLEVAERDAAWFVGRGIIGIDELGIVLEDHTAALALEAAYRRFRSITPRDPHHHAAHHVHDDNLEPSRRVMIGVSQRPSDLLKHDRGKVLADLAKTRVYLGIESTEMSVVSKQLGLAADEQTFIESADQGTGLLVSGEARVGFHLTPTAEELSVGRT
jgi:hypothetical protein